MNRPVFHCLLMAVWLTLLLTGCFGGAAPVRPQAQLQAETALNRGIRAQQKGDSAGAVTFLTQSLTISSSIEDVPARVTALINLARLHRLQHDLPMAETYIDRALATSADAPRFAAEAAYEKALVELFKGAPATALAWAEKSIIAEQGDALGSRLNLAARIQFVRGEWGAAGVLAGKALGANRLAGQAEEEANSLRILGGVARHEKRYAAGLEFLQEALLIDKRIGKSGKIAVDLEELAATAQDAGRLKESAAWLERACEVHRAGGRLRQAQENQAALANLYTALGEPLKADLAREAARKSVLPDGSQGSGNPSTTINPSSNP